MVSLMVGGASCGRCSPRAPGLPATSSSATGAGDASLRTVANTAAITSAAPITAETPEALVQDHRAEQHRDGGIDVLVADDRRDRQVLERPDVGRERDAPGHDEVESASSERAEAAVRSSAPKPSSATPAISHHDARDEHLDDGARRTGRRAGSAAGRRTSRVLQNSDATIAQDQPRVVGARAAGREQHEHADDAERGAGIEPRADALARRAPGSRRPRARSWMPARPSGSRARAPR